jgi:hypothetical protein
VKAATLPSAPAPTARRRTAATLQTNSPAARRLHYWELPGAGIELAKVVYHDDFSIS